MEVVQAKRVAATILITDLLEETNVRRRGKTREWIKRREEKGAFNNVIRELGLEDSGGFNISQYISQRQGLDSYKSMMDSTSSSVHFLISDLTFAADSAIFQTLNQITKS